MGNLMSKKNYIISFVVILLLLAVAATLFILSSSDLQEVQAISGEGKFQLVYSVKDTWGETRIIRLSDTYVGYIQTRDKNGNVTDMTMIVNVFGEPVRYDDHGNAIVRVDPEVRKGTYTVPEHSAWYNPLTGELLFDEQADLKWEEETPSVRTHKGTMPGEG